MHKSVAIVGAGSVGTNAAIFLSRLGVDVLLIDSEADILQGAPKASFINHGDGFEYYKPGHQATGKYCIDGALTKALIYPIDYFRTNVATEKNPIRFFISKKSSENGAAPLAEFVKNATDMHLHFNSQFQAIVNSTGWTNQITRQRLLRSPEDFFKILGPIDFVDVAQIAGGCSGSSFGINMAHYYAYLKSAINHEKITFVPGMNITCLEKFGEKYNIHSAGNSYKIDYILITANHHIPTLIQNTKNFIFKYKASGTYYLNSMTFLTLPPTHDSQKIKELTRINFTLQGENGCMFACVVPPSAAESGLAVIYFPSVQGSQLHNNIYDRNHPISNPLQWDNFIKSGLDDDDEAVLNTLKQAYRFYPFLKDYASVSRTICRPVFNVGVNDSYKGTDRRVREISDKPIFLSSDEHVSAWTSPKWTNAELVALMATDHVCHLAGLPQLPKGQAGTFGPTNLNVAAIADQMNLLNLKMNIEDAYKYASSQGIPKRIVNKDIEAFT